MWGLAGMQDLTAVKTGRFCDLGFKRNLAPSGKMQGFLGYGFRLRSE
jgi:hypothetical protein